MVLEVTSMADKNTVCVSIFGGEYTISGTESKQYITSVCAEVDKMMRALAKGMEINPMNVAVLTAVNFCDEKIKTSQEHERLKAQLGELKSEIASLQTQNKVLTEENAYIKDELKTTKKNLAERSKR